MTWYDTLGVSPTCSRQELRTAFEAQKARLEVARQKSQSHAHRARIEVEWRAIHAAWDILGHPARRRAYDRQPGITPSTTPPAASSKPLIPYRWLLFVLLLLTIAVLGHLAPLPLLVVSAGVLLAATLIGVAMPHRP